MFWHNLWSDDGRPHSGVIADIMRRTIASYNYAIKFVKENEADLVKKRFAEAVVENRSRNFWAKVKKIRSNGDNSVSSVVDGVSDSIEITKLVADKYEDLYACVSYDEGQMTALRTEIDSMVNSNNSAQDSNVNCVGVLDAVTTLKHIKSDGNRCDDCHVICIYKPLFVNM